MSEDANLSSSRVLLGFSGDYTAGETPLPIPNRAVKPRRADGTIWVTVWESRSLPGVIDESPVLVKRIGLSSSMPRCISLAHRCTQSAS